MSIQSFNIEPNLLSSSQSFINFPFFNDILILFGNFSLSFIISSFPKFSLNLLSTSDNNSSSLSFKAVLIFVKIFCIFNFNCSFLSSILSNIIFISFIESVKLFDKSSKYFILSFNLFFFSSFISLISQISQFLCCPYPLASIFVIQ